MNNQLLFEKFPITTKAGKHPGETMSGKCRWHMRVHCVRSHIGKGISMQHLSILELKGVDKKTLEALKKAGVTATIRRGSLHTPAMRNRHAMAYTQIENQLW